jgi:cytochrome bd-type quinol oxidase subunit 1
LNPSAGTDGPITIRGDLQKTLQPLPPTYHDLVRFRLAVGMLAGVGVLASLLIVLVTAGWLPMTDAKELALTIVALFGIVAPIIGFYFAAKERG